MDGYHSSDVNLEIELEMVEKIIEYRSFVIHSWCLENLDDPELTSGPDKWIRNAVKICRQNILKSKV
jgi:hypothetical protein